MHNITVLLFLFALMFLCGEWCNLNKLSSLCEKFSFYLQKFTKQRELLVVFANNAISCFCNEVALISSTLIQ